MLRSRGISILSIIFSVIISVMSGIVIALLFFFLFIPFIRTAIWIVLGLTVIILFSLFDIAVLSSITRCTFLRTCICHHVKTVFILALITLIFCLASLSIVLTNFISVTILIGFGAFFFGLMLFSFYHLVKCLLMKECHPQC